MCTVSWIHEPGGYQLFCNRDEARTRKPAVPPQVLDLQGVKTIAPRDGDFGGSWISVNEFGLTLCLLNFHQTQRGPDFSLAQPVRRTEVWPTDFTSRGLLLMELASSRSREEVLGRIAEVRLEKFQPFTLLTLMPCEAALMVRWDGGECLIDRDAEARMPLTSSSFDSGKVVEARKQRFHELTADRVADVPSAPAIREVRTERPRSSPASLLLEYHRSHDPAPSAYSTCMHRIDAETVSFSRINVDSNSVEFRYHPHSPCREGKAEIQVLPRAK